MSWGIEVIAYIIIPLLIILGIKIKKEKIIQVDRDSTDSIKGVLVILVALSHMAMKVKSTLIFAFPFTQFGMYCVALFFFFSGYGLTKSYLKDKDSYIKQFWSKRILNLYIPFLIANVISIIISIANENTFSLLEIIIYISGIKLRDTTLWFVQTIILFYIASYLSFKYFDKVSNKIILISSLIYIIGGYYLNLGEWQINTAIMFYIGYLYCWKENEINIYFYKSYKKVFIITVLIMCMVKAISMKYYSVLSSVVCGNITSLCLVIIIILLFKHIRINSGILIFLKKYSYEMYLLHMKIMLLLDTTKPIGGLSITFYLIMLILSAAVLNIVSNIRFYKKKELTIVSK